MSLESFEPAVASLPSPQPTASSEAVKSFEHSKPLEPVTEPLEPVTESLEPCELVESCRPVTEPLESIELATKSFGHLGHPTTTGHYAMHGEYSKIGEAEKKLNSFKKRKIADQTVEFIVPKVNSGYFYSADEEEPETVPRAYARVPGNHVISNTYFHQSVINDDKSWESRRFPLPASCYYPATTLADSPTLKDSEDSSPDGATVVLPPTSSLLAAVSSHNEKLMPPSARFSPSKMTTKNGQYMIPLPDKF
eukprot:TRINITY_DN9107_c0_g1_i2.p1 TRINITY_DN9107_c0_g1~~TRINITY_DN9107_c0_g1_i2.p1  ORF type:complete len:251 (-),score=37.48 TRINITY_DN9107_c0_g1_i2:72-824(-)